MTKNKTLIIRTLSLLFLITLFISSDPTQAQNNNVINYFKEPTSKNLTRAVKDVKDNEIKETITLVKLAQDSSEKLNFVIPFNPENGEYIKINKGEEGIQVNSANIYSSNGNSIGIIAFENKENIDLSKVDGHLEIQVSSRENTIDVSYLIASYTYEDYFNSSNWIVRDNITSLSINPKPLLWDSGILEWTSIRNDSWEKLLDKHIDDSKFSNQNGMKDQYYCHFDFAKGNKIPWNIEPSRPDVGYIKTVLKACNP
ncbi:DUF2599 domain-containing protein [Virgibacillus dokdonensis]|uniref:DUF2599 domain-containing protein n=1 Tax=Virgibacillus dokdonensis TaxID=302167 RepID=A0A2K9J3T3_9BACI|nr:DUF2599 domain-containing protein [Virgibacillus dokdonensis]AUJ24671.1 hypothetical protein A21D_01590 [Virgibacillus dokdonensis]